MERQKFIHPSEKRESDVILSKGRLLGSPSQEAKIYEATVQVGGHKRNMVLKEFFDGPASTARQRAEYSFKNYQLAQAAGLKVFTTFRLSADRKKILMTNGNDEEMVLLDVNSTQEGLSSALDGEYIRHIDNYEETLEAVYQQILKADEHNLSLWCDTLFFLLDKKTKSHLDFVLGDLGSVVQASKGGNVSSIVWTFNNAIRDFLNKNMAEDVRGEYIRRTEEFFESKERAPQIH